jgi:hypothetical protein
VLFFNTPTTTDCSLRGFCDASSKAYAAVIYLKIKATDGVRIQFVTSKTRAAPRKQTIPRLELLSAVLLSRLMTSVTKALESELNLGAPIFYTDSLVALYWITSHKEWKQFVRNRVVEIQKLTPIDSWRHCKGTSNPADIPSRGATPTELLANPIWLEGPSWLIQEENTLYTEESVSNIEPPEGSLEELKNTRTLHSSIGTSSVAIFDCEKVSSLNRLLRVTAYIFKFIKMLRTRHTTSVPLH